MNDIVIKIGELLVRAGIVTGVDLSEAEKLAKHMNLQFGQVLIMSGCLSEHDLDCALVAQQLIREELLTVEVACQALAIASQHQMPFEDALEALSVVPKYGAASVEMAELLADCAIIPGEMLEAALMTSLTSNVSLGELLVRENAISSSLIPVLNVMLADIGAGTVNQDHAIGEIRKSHFNWQRSLDSASSHEQVAPVAPAVRGPEPSPVFVSQELMHAYETYEPHQHQDHSRQSHQSPTAFQQSQPQNPPSLPQPNMPQPNLSQPNLPPLPPNIPPIPPQLTPRPPQTPSVSSYPSAPQFPGAPQTGTPQHSQSSPGLPSHPGLSHPAAPQPGSAPHVGTPQPAPAADSANAQSGGPLSIHDVLSMFQQRNPVSESANQAVQRDQQAASWSAFVQSQSFDPNDVEPSTPPISVAADEPRAEVVQGTYAKTFDGKSADLLPETFEQTLPDFEPAAEVLEAETKKVSVPTPVKVDDEVDDEEDEDEDDDDEQEDEQFSLLVELLIESSHFDREDIIVAITNALKEESKAVKLMEMLDLADEKAIMAASICADAMHKEELTSGEAVTVLSDIKSGAEIFEALEKVNLELAVTLSANFQMMYDDEVDESFYVGDVSKTVDIFEPDDFNEEANQSANLPSNSSAKRETSKEASAPVPPPVVEVKDDTPPIAFGYGRERLKIAKRAEPQPEEVKEAPKEAPSPPPVQAPVQAPAPVAAKVPERTTTIGGKKVSSLSEVFEKLSGVESSAQPTVAKPPAASGSAGSTGATVRPGAPVVKPLGTPPGSFGKPPVPSNSNSSTTPISPANPTRTPSSTPSSTSIPNPTSTPTSTPTPKISPVTPPASAAPNDPTPASTPFSGTPSSAASSAPMWANAPVSEAKSLVSDSSKSAPVTKESSPVADATSDSFSDKSDEDKKAARKRNSTTFNSLQAVFVPGEQNTSEASLAPEPAANADSAEPAKQNADGLAPVSNDATTEYAAYMSGKPADAEAKITDDVKSEAPKEEHEDAKAETPKEEHADAKAEAPKEEHADSKAEAPKEEHVDAKAEAPKEEHAEVKSESPKEEADDESDKAEAPKETGTKSSKKKSKDSEVNKEKEEDAAEDVADEEEEHVSPGSSKKKPRSSKAKIRGGAKNNAPAPKKTKRRK